MANNERNKQINAHVNTSGIGKSKIKNPKTFPHKDNDNNNTTTTTTTLTIRRYWNSNTIIFTIQKKKYYSTLQENLKKRDRNETEKRIYF